MIGVSTQTDFNSYTQYFNNSMQGFRELTDISKLNKKPERIRIKTVSSNQTLAQALRSYNVPDRRNEESAILNGMKLTDNLTSGTLIKIIAE